MKRSEIILAGKAFSERWPMPPEARRALMEKLYAVALGSKYERNTIAAGKALAEFDRINLLAAMQANNESLVDALLELKDKGHDVTK